MENQGVVAGVNRTVIFTLLFQPHLLRRQLSFGMTFTESVAMVLCGGNLNLNLLHWKVGSEGATKHAASNTQSIVAVRWKRTSFESHRAFVSTKK